MKFPSLLLLFASHAAALSLSPSTRKVYKTEKMHSASALNIPAFAASIAIPSSLGKSNMFYTSIMLVLELKCRRFKLYHVPIKVSSRGSTEYPMGTEEL
jgi:hypothetical protein